MKLWSKGDKVYCDNCGELYAVLKVDVCQTDIMHEDQFERADHLKNGEVIECPNCKVDMMPTLTRGKNEKPI